MNTEHIDHATAERAIAAGAIRSALVGAKGREWSVRLRFGRHSPALIGKRGEVRTWSRLDTLAAYLKGLGLFTFEVDASGHDASQPKARSRGDSAARLRQVHDAAAYDRWFREQVQLAVREADDPATEWISNEDMKAEGRRLRAKYQRMAKKQLADRQHKHKAA